MFYSHIYNFTMKSSSYNVRNEPSKSEQRGNAKTLHASYTFLCRETVTI